MTFTTKKYTRPALRKAVRSVNVSNFTSYSNFVNALSPRAGSKSAQVAALRGALPVSLKTAFSGSAKSNKSFLLSILK